MSISDYDLSQLISNSKLAHTLDKYKNELDELEAAVYAKLEELNSTVNAQEVTLSLQAETISTQQNKITQLEDRVAKIEAEINSK